MAKLDTAVLFIVFNRIETTRIAFEAIRKAKPPRLYVAADGPRRGNIQDVKKCQEVREIVKEIDWACDVKTLLRDDNLGCKDATVGAIDWFFENETEGIIIEDDVVPADSFFLYAESILSRYRTSDEIGAVIGFNDYGQHAQNNSYFFYSGYCFYPWGWATWKRVWDKFDVDNVSLKKFKSIKPVNSKERELYDLLGVNLRLIDSKLLDTWDFMFVYWLLLTSRLVVVPYANQIKNIGVNGVHSRNNFLEFEYGNFDSRRIIHPAEVRICHDMDDKYFTVTKGIKRSVFIKDILLRLKIYGPVRYLKKVIFR